MARLAACRRAMAAVPNHDSFCSSQPTVEALRRGLREWRVAGMLRTPLLPSEAEEELPWYRDGAVWGAVGNVSMTMIGTVVLTLPAALAALGWGLGLALLVVFALLCDLSMIFLVRCAANSATTPRVTEDALLPSPPPQEEEEVTVGYEQLGTRLLGAGAGIAVRCALLALLGTATITTNIIVIDMTQSNLAAMGLSPTSPAWGWLASRWFLSAVNIGLMVRASPSHRRAPSTEAMVLVTASPGGDGGGRSSRSRSWRTWVRCGTCRW